MDFGLDFLTKDIGMAAALIATVVLFLNHIQKEGKENQQNMKMLIDDFNNRVKDIFEISENRLREAKESHEKILTLISDNHQTAVRELCNAQEKMQALVSAKVEEVVRITENTRTLVATHAVREIEKHK